MSKIKPRSIEDYKKGSREMEIILDNIPGLIFFKDTANNFIRVNQRMADAYNLSKEQLMGKSLFDLHSKEQAQAYWDDDLDVIKSGISKLNIEEPWETEEGVRWLNTNKIPYIDDNGKIRGIIGFSVDITERKIAEIKLKESEENFQSLFEHITAGFAYHKIILDEKNNPIDYIFLEANPAFEELTGLKVNDIIGKKVTEILPGIENDPADWINKYGKVALTGISITFENYAKPLDQWYSVSAYSPKKEYFAATFINITERKKAEEELKKSLETTKKILEALPVGIISIGKDKRIRAINKVGLDLLNIEHQEELLGKKCYDYFCPAEVNSCPIFDLEQDIDVSERILRTKENVELPILKSVIPINLEGEDVLLEAFIDISAQKEAERILRVSKERLRRLNEELEFKIKERTHALNERVKEITCLYEISKLAENREISLEEFLLKTPSIIINAFQFPNLAHTRIIYGDKEFKSINFKETRWKLSTRFSANNKIMMIEVYYDENRPYLKEEENLIDDVGRRLKNIIEQKKSDKKLKKSEEKFRAISTSAHDAIIQMDDHYEITFWNKSAEAIFGYSFQEVLGKNISMLIPEQFKAKFENLILNFFSSKGEQFKGRTIEVYGLRKDGKEFPTELSFSKFLIKGKKNAISIVRDISKRKVAEKALKEAEIRYRTTFEQSPDGILIVDLDSLIAIEFNKAICEILGYTKEEFGKLRIPDIDINGSETRIHVGKVLKEGRDDFQTKFRTKSGLIKDMFITAKLINLSGKTCIQAIARDITERKKGENALLETLEKLKSSNLELEQFAYVASHDLQEPLRMISNFIQLLEKRYKNKLDEDANDFIHYVVDGASRMQNLIDNLIIYSRVGTQGNPFKPTDMNIVLDNVISYFRQIIKETNALITVDPLPLIIADESQMIQLFQNLISNALKFRSDKEPRIHITGEVSERDWIFSVRDNGIGVESKNFDRIFIIFQRLYKKEEYDGRGIGLAICKKIVRRHGGKIRVESELGIGTTFHISIPRRTTQNYN